MARCEGCGTDYDKSLETTQGGKSHVFDSYTCAIHALAPTCAHWSGVIGHGVESGVRSFSCTPCASAVGVAGLTDRV
jgi:hypothetical protein